MELFSSIDPIKSYFSDGLLDSRVKEPAHNPILDAARESTIENIEFVTQQLCVLYRSKATSTRAADFRDVFLLNGDLHDLDLTGADITGSKFQNVNLANTDLGGDVKFRDSHFVDSHWWDAREIAKPLLQFLIENQYPYFDNTKVSYTVSPLDKQRYVERVQELCKKASLVCQSASIRYGVPPSPKEAQAGNQ
jgi:hypothetical protein